MVEVIIIRLCLFVVVFFGGGGWGWVKLYSQPPAYFGQEYLNSFALSLTINRQIVKETVCLIRIVEIFTGIPFNQYLLIFH